MALWTMTPVGERVLVVPAHRAYAAAMTEDDPLTPGDDSERRKADLREKDRGMGRPRTLRAWRGRPLWRGACGDAPERRGGVSGRVRRLPGAGGRGAG